jgi:poly-gamma-glutamate capsule biosynthesis protein CapA/YwtB (metallophosphatase superfamily)
MDNPGISLYAVGDIHINRSNPDEVFDLARPILKEADITFGHCEGVIGGNSPLQPGIGHSHAIMDPGCPMAFKNAGLKVMGCAGNHSMDYLNFLDTIDALRKVGIIAFGMGKDIDEARKPAIVEIKGTRVGFLTVNCINNQSPFELHAGVGKPGTPYLRIHSSYEIEDNQPGTSPIVHTQPDEHDLKGIIKDIEKLRPQVDVLVWTPHWGVHNVPNVLGEYELKVAHMVIDAGADLIIGHHPHILKGIEIYKGKAIIYSMGFFNFDNYGSVPRQIIEKYGPGNVPEEIIANFDAKPQHRYQTPGVAKRKYEREYPYNQVPPLSRMGIIVKCSIANKQIQKVSIVPTRTTKGKCQPEPLSIKSEGGKEIMKFIEEASEYFDTKFTKDGDEAVVIGV